MRVPLLLVACLSGLLARGETVRTDYGQVRTLRIVAETDIVLETSMEMTVDGEPADRGGFGGGISSEESRTVVILDNVLAGEPGKPTHVRRTFETLESESYRSFGEREFDETSQGPLAGVVLDLSADEHGEVEIEVLEGDEPDDTSLLEGHVLALCVDALFPLEAVEEGDAWDLEADAVKTALSLALDARLFPAPERDGAREAGAGRGEGGRGRRSGRGGGGAAFLAEAEWEGKALLASTDEDYEGETCVMIEIELETSGDMPELGFGGPRRGGRAWSIVPARFAAEGTYSVALEGKLHFSKDGRRPVRLELSGEIESESSNEFDRDGRVMSMQRSSEGTFSQTITVTEE